MTDTPDYDRLFDAPTWAFIRDTYAAYPEDTADMSVADQRRIYDGMARAFHRGYPPGVTATDHSYAGVPCRIYAGVGGTVVYFHGGGFVVGGLASHDDVCAEIAHQTGLCVVSVDYRLAPEHPHPAAYDDAVAATRAVAEAGPLPLILVGDSAGGNLAAAVAHSIGRHGAHGVRGMVLIYPGLGGDQTLGSYVTHAHAPMLSLADVTYYGQIRHGGQKPETDDPSFAPLSDADFTGLPPTLALGAECDPLHDDAHAYAQAISAAGGRAMAITEYGLPHGYLRARARAPRAADSFGRITTAIGRLAAGLWPPIPG